MQEQIQVMLDLQQAMNAKVHDNWQERGFQWYRAIWVECAELMDHYGWKWWKKQTLDREQVELELIDIWHFGLSMLLISGESAASIAERLSAGMQCTSDKDFREVLEIFVGDILATKHFCVEKFAVLLNAADLSFECLYSGYVGKNVLNVFRQDHGYKEGSYHKVWQGREDNEHLVDIISTLDVDCVDFQHLLYQGLLARYRQMVLAQVC